MAQITACKTDAIGDGEALVIKVPGRGDIALFHVGGAFFALDDLCTHGSASMAEGYIEEDCTVECPLHAARFCLKTGEALCQPATEALRTYPVEVVDGEVLIETGEAA